VRFPPSQNSRGGRSR